MDLVIRLWRDFRRNPFQPRYTAPLIIINILGSVYGYFWYREQLAVNPLYFWPFIPDSPLSTTIFALALLIQRRGFASNLFQAVAFTANIKYGLWAAVIISQYWLGGGQAEFIEIMLMLSHLGMAVQGGIYLKQVRLGQGVALLTAAWMVINDFMDYYVGLHPYLFTAGQDFIALLAAAGLTALITGVLLVARTVRRM